jgi:hypothetical protein
MIGASLLLVVFCGCGKRTREEANPAPSSSMEKQTALNWALRWAETDPGRSYREVAATGSMLPVFDSRSVLLLERVKASDLKPNDIALYATALDGSGDATISHRIREVRPDGVLFDGDNNQASDGWIAPGRVRWRVCGILYTRR